MYRDFHCASIGGQVMSGCSRRLSLDWTQDLPFGAVICDGGYVLKGSSATTLCGPGSELEVGV
jgi:hypothetical protein